MIDRYGPRKDLAAKSWVSFWTNRQRRPKATHQRLVISKDEPVLGLRRRLLVGWCQEKENVSRFQQFGKSCSGPCVDQGLAKLSLGNLPIQPPKYSVWGMENVVSNYQTHRILMTQRSLIPTNIPPQSLDSADKLMFFILSSLQA